MSTAIQEQTVFDQSETNVCDSDTTVVTDLFNDKLANILIMSASTGNNDYYTEFLTLCSFYKKVNNTNVEVIKQIIKLFDDKKQSPSENKQYIKSLTWDCDDPDLCNFMTCVLNL